MGQLKILIFIPIYLILISSGISCERILFFSAISAKSENILFGSIVQGLAEAGHKVTHLSSVISPQINSSRVTQIKILEAEDIFSVFSNALEYRAFLKSNILYRVMLDFDFILEACHTIYKHPKFNEFLGKIIPKTPGGRPQIQFDLVLMADVTNNCFAGLLTKLGVPYILVSAITPANFQTTPFGNYLPPSFHPSPLLPYSNQMSFYQRMVNSVLDLSGMIFFGQVAYPQFEDIYRKYLGQDLPSLRKIQSDASLLLINSNFLTSGPKPLMPSVIEIAGMHCHPPKPLPNDLENFVNPKVSKSNPGFIYFSLGTIVQAKNLDEKVIQAFVRVFSKLKQRIIWKWEGGAIANLPENVKLVKFAPQQDLLGHPNIRLFITHGGLFSSQEALYHGVPLLGFPVGFDQDNNLMHAQENGFAKIMEILDVEEESLEESVKSLLNPKYLKRAKELSKIFKDQPKTPLETTIWWVEYILRHKGAIHLSSPAKNLNILQYHSIDVILFLLGSILAAFYFIKWTLKSIWSRLFGKSGKLNGVNGIKYKTN